MDIEKLKEVACEAIDQAAEDLAKLSHFIWSNPELAHEEFKAHDAVTEILDKYKFPQVDRKFILPTGFRAVCGDKAKGPHVALLTEYDALPEIGHASGHNLIVESGVAIAIALKACFEAAGQPFGKVSLLGTPAEEQRGGKLSFIKAQVFKDVDFAMTAHPSQYYISRPNYVAISEVTMHFTGVEAHAAEFPWEGVNALDAAILCYNNVSCMRQQLPPGWMLHGIVTDGGARPNIIPRTAALEYYIRTPKNRNLKKLEKMLKNCVDGAALATDCDVKMKLHSTFLNLLTNEEMTKTYEENASRLGIQTDTDKESILKKLGGSTDVGNVSYEVPTIHPEFEIGADCNTHSMDFTTAAGDPKAQKYTLDMAKALAMTCIDIMLKPELLAKIKAEFEVESQ